MRLSNILLIILAFVSACTESFIPETSEYDDVLFIEAQVTNDPTTIPHVLISKSLPVATQETDPPPRSSAMVSGASVTIHCDDGNEYIFSENEPGRYIPLDPLFIGEPGKSYSLTVVYDNQTYESSNEILRTSPPVDSLSREAVREKISDTGEAVYGLRFFAHTHDEYAEPSYYRWDLDATFRYIIPLFSTHRWINKKVVFSENTDVMVCFSDKFIDGIFVSSTEGLERNVVNAPLHFESQYGDKLSDTYSLHAKQLKISERTYKFWDDLSKLIYETGGLYETQPFRLEGNISCTSNPDINIIGIFEVAGVAERRDFFFMPKEFEILRLRCEYIRVGSEDLPWDQLKEGAFLLEEMPGEFWSERPTCFDCQERGGTVIKPPFWEL